MKTMRIESNVLQLKFSSICFILRQ